MARLEAGTSEARSSGRWQSEEGQTIVLFAVALLGMCAIAGFAIDVGVAYKAHRSQQSLADAAALAGAYDLPNDTGLATSDAQSNAAQNGGSANSITYSTQYLPNDTITVKTTKTVPTHFLTVLGVKTFTVGATAVAQAETLATASGGSAPFGVINTQPELAGPGCPCFGIQTTLDMTKVGPGSFSIIDIDGSKGGTSPGILANWIEDGCSCSTATPLWLYSDPGAKFNPSQVKSAMDSVLGKNVLFPVYDATQGNGTNLQYHVIGFAGFNVVSYDVKGTNMTITGSFVKVDWTGFGTSNTSTYFGATTSQLIG